MSFGPPRVRSMNIADPENKRPPTSPTAKKWEVKKTGKLQQRKETIPTKEEANNKKCSGKAASVLRQKSMNASCSSEASSDSASVASSSSSAAGRLASVIRRRDGAVGVRPRKQCGVRVDKEGKISAPIAGGGGDGGLVMVESNNEVRGGDECNVKGDCFEQKKRCVWATPTSDPCYVSFHDEEWGVPVHNDRKLFELLSLSGALAELTWPTILSKRHILREVFWDFDPLAVSRLNEKKLVTAGSPASSLLSELKLRSIVENARQMCKVIEEFGSFSKYIWNFLNHKPIVNQFRYSRQVPVKTSKAEAISKDLVRRGFRSVGPTVIYSFMQVAGLTNDHLTSCFRYQECVACLESREKDEACKATIEKKESDVAMMLEEATTA